MLSRCPGSGLDWHGDVLHMLPSTAIALHELGKSRPSPCVFACILDHL